MIARIRVLVPLIALFGACLLAPADALAQSRPISVTDQRQTTKIIRAITKTSDTAVTGLSRLQANVDTLLRRLKDKGADDVRIAEVATYYQRSATATRILAEARINRDANKQIVLLRSRSNPGDLLLDLELAKSAAISQARAAENAALESIAHSRDSLVQQATP